MSKELIERLRYESPGPNHIAIEAADHIEQLETERNQLREELSLARMQNVVVYGISHPEMYKTKEDELREQVKMLREGMVAINTTGVMREAKWTGMSARDIARFTLAATEPTSTPTDI